MIIWILSNTMEYDSSWYRPAEFILLIVSSILQIICISAPWWHIATHKERISTMIGPDGVLLNSTVPEERLYHGVFYGIKCNASSCKTMTIREYHLQETDQSGPYDFAVMEQVTVMVVFAITIACLPFQVRMLRSKYSQFLLTTLGNAMCLSFAGGLMLRHLVQYYVIENDNFQQSKTNQYFDVTLPYCVLLYTVAFVLTTLAVVLYAVEVCRIRQNRKREDQLVTDDVAMVPAGIDNSVNSNTGWSSLT